MNKKYKAIALAMGVLTLASVGLTACKSNKTTEVPTINPNYVYDGTHVYTAEDTNDYLVKNGATDYTLVVPSVNTSSMRIARTEFVDLFKEATGIAINVVRDDQVANATSGKYISLGKTTLLQDAGIEINPTVLDNDGHRIVTKGDDIYLCGGSDEGTVFSVYTFMRLTFNYETYYYDCMEIDRVSEKKLKNYDVTDIPDFKFRAHSSDVTTYDSADYAENMFAWRLGYYGKEATRGYYWMPVHDCWWDMSSGSKGASTNADHWFPEYLYNDKENNPDTYHPKWFSSMGGGQLCFSAYGDKVEYEAMVNEAFEKVKAHLAYYTPDKYPRYRVMTLTHMDNTNYCKCKSCREISSYYADSQAAVQMLFMNDLAEKVDEYLNANKDKAWYREDFQLLFFAYNHNFDPPTRYDATKKQYVPIDDEVILHDRVIAWFCRDANGQAVFDEDRNEDLVNTLEGWSVVANHIYYWNYGTNFKAYMYPLDSFQYSTPAMYAYFCNKSDDFWFTQFQDRNNSTNTAWHNLKVYLDAKLSWDTSLNAEELTQKWMKAMYKDAAPTMYRLFQSLRAYEQHVLIGEYELFSNGDGSPDIEKAIYWPVGLLQGWLAEIDQAKKSLDRYKVVDPELYDEKCKHIEVEAISTLYILLSLHGDMLSPSLKTEYVERLRYDMEWLDLQNMRITSKVLLSAWLEKL